MAQGMDEFIPRPGTDLQVVAEERVITTTANGPDDDVYCAPVSDPTLADGPCRWSPRIEPDGDGGVRIRYPERGDRALYIESDEAEHWIVDWTPYA